MVSLTRCQMRTSQKVCGNPVIKTNGNPIQTIARHRASTSSAVSLSRAYWRIPFTVSPLTMWQWSWSLSRISNAKYSGKVKTLSERRWPMRPVSLLQSNNLLRRVSQWMRHRVSILKIMQTVGSRWLYRSRPSKKFNRTSHSQRLETHIRATKIKRGSTLYQGAQHLS